jgi:multidrug efflux pump subunit AcrB
VNPAALALRNKTSTLVFVVLIVIGGLLAYRGLARLEDPEFTIKDAKVITAYPGATAREVEEEVTDVVETAVKELGQIKHVRSTSSPGRSIVTVTIKDQYDRRTLPQVWDELRRKVTDAQGRLPPGAGPSLILDDFGDVFGIFLALSGDGFSYAELRDAGRLLQRELRLVPDVAKVTLSGLQRETIYIEISRARLASLGVPEAKIYAALAGKNLVGPSGAVEVGRERIRILPEPGLETVTSIGNIVIEGAGSGRQLFVRDVATVTRSVEDPPSSSLRLNGEPAVGLGISVVSGGNVVIMGDALKRRIAELKSRLPVGLELGTIYFQPDIVVRAINGFVRTLAEAVVIVIGVLVISMGVRSGLLIGASLVLTILSTLIAMSMYGVALERISLGAMVIALSMMVDNAVVVSEGMLIGVQQGGDAEQVAGKAVAGTMWPLLGGTAIAVLAFAAIGLSQDKTGEYTFSLFLVILFAIGLSWVLAVTVTPVLGVMILKAKPAGTAAKDPYDSVFYRGYRSLLAGCMRFRWATLVLMVALLALSIYGFRFVPRSFFPDSTTPQFTVDFWVRQGTDIGQTAADLAVIEQQIRKLEGVKSVATSVGQGFTRFLLTYSPEEPNPAYGQLIVTVDRFERMAELMPRVEAKIMGDFPESLAIANAYVLGPGGGSDIEARLRGPDHRVLRRLSGQVQAIMRGDPAARDVRDDWREPVMVVRPQLSELAASNAGISRRDISRTLQRNFSGLTVGVFREGEELLPMVARAPAAERLDVDKIRDVQVWSPVAGATVPLRQIVSGFTTEWDDGIIARRNRRPTITAQANAIGNVGELFQRLRPRIEALALPPGYSLEWGGEHESASEAMAALAGQLPPTLILMMLIVIVLFNALRQPAIIWLTAPLGMIGVTAALLVTGQPFGFMAILGALSLIGMLVSNSIVLIEEIDNQIREGKDRFQGILEGSVSRLRPVGIMALTTVLGMIPLLQDVFFASMAVTIMGGLAFATVLTLLVVPVLYAVMFRIPSPKAADERGSGNHRVLSSAIPPKTATPG